MRVHEELSLPSCWEVFPGTDGLCGCGRLTVLRYRGVRDVFDRVGYDKAGFANRESYRRFVAPHLRYSWREPASRARFVSSAFAFTLLCPDPARFLLNMPLRGV